MKMAEGRTGSPAKVLCRYFASGVCREGARCKFSHDRTHSVPDTVCRYYIQGRCSYNERCRYDHIRPNQNSANSRNESRSRTEKQPTGSSQTSSAKLNNSHNSHTSSSWTTLNSHSLGNASVSNTPPTGRMTVLRKQGQSEDSGLGEEPSQSSSPLTGPGSPDWVNAPEFIPRTSKSYADTLKAEDSLVENSFEQEIPGESMLCPYAMVGECPYATQCIYVHGEVCELCSRACLNPFDKEQQKQHTEECEKELERDMELSFAIQRSIGKTCGICMDVIMEKQPPSERRFGILEKCNHIFCLSCIRQWRKTKQFESRHISSTLDPLVIRACPECRVVSDFVTPSRYWVDTKEEKEKLITDYKKALSTKPCKYFKQGRGECPFAGACFYLHAYPDGTKAELPPPRPRRRRNQDGEIEPMDRIFLWDFFELRDDHLLFHLELEDMLDLFSDTDDESDWSDLLEDFLVD